MAILFMATLGQGQAFDLLTHKGPIKVRGTGRVLVDPDLDPEPKDGKGGPGVLGRIEAYNRARPGTFVELSDDVDPDRPLLEWVPESTAGPDQVRLWLACADVNYASATGIKGLHDLVGQKVQQLQKAVANNAAENASIEFMRARAELADELKASLQAEGEARRAAEKELAAERAKVSAERDAFAARLAALEAKLSPTASAAGDDLDGKGIDDLKAIASAEGVDLGRVRTASSAADRIREARAAGPALVE